MYKVLTDFHHAGLLQSLIFLFEKRLGGTVYRPIGREWFDKGFWKVYDHPATVEQFLGIGGNTPDGTPKLNEVEYTNRGIEGLYYCHDIESGNTNKAITFDAFMSLDIDIVIASIPQHVEPFKTLCNIHPNKPKLIFQIGNAWTIEAAKAPNIMASAIIHDVPSDINLISYHQEFDVRTFYANNQYPDKNIYSFVNCFDIAGHYAKDWQLFTQMEREMPEWTYRSFGGQCRDGAVGPVSVLAETMRKARFIWHTKAGGDGYGHVIHNAFSVGRPPIVKKSYYVDKLSEPLLIDESTCIAIDGLTYPQIINKIEHYSEPERYKTMSKNAHDIFTQYVDFDKEEESLRGFLKMLI